MNAADGDLVDLRSVKRDRAARRMVAAWRRLMAGTAFGGVPADAAAAGTVIACSGGVDSTALLLALVASEPGRLTAAHVLHDMRPAAEAEADRDFVRGLAARLGVGFAEGRVRVRAEPGNIEAAARRARYAELARLASEAGAAFVATGHQADDQLESILMALLRGAGPRGMRGIAASRPIGRGGAAAGGSTDGVAEEDVAGGVGGRREVRLIRPMLRVTREDAERICAIAGVAWREDRTNLDVSRLRAALRHEVTPLLRGLRPRASEHAAATADLMQQAQQVIDRETAELMHAASISDAAVSWPRRALAAAPPLLIGDSLRTAAAHLQGLRGRDRLTGRALRPIIRAIRDGSTDSRRFELRGVTVAVTAHTVTASKRE